MPKERCYLIPAKDGLGFIKVRAEKKPTGKTLAALQDLFSAAYRDRSKHIAKATAPTPPEGRMPPLDHEQKD